MAVHRPDRSRLDGGGPVSDSQAEPRAARPARAPWATSVPSVPYTTGPAVGTPATLALDARANRPSTASCIASVISLATVPETTCVQAEGPKPVTLPDIKFEVQH